MADAGGRNGTYYVPCLYRTAVVPSDDQLPAPSSCSLLCLLLHCPSMRVHDRNSLSCRHRLSHHQLSSCSEAESIAFQEVPSVHATARLRPLPAERISPLSLLKRETATCKTSFSLFELFVRTSDPSLHEP
ncbi:hypothetical protein BTJ68_14261 [Hortaea werneckii EXF-2000]|uniref:Uncharacterized protein n=2 Tax=Hortaea werneckii TaxID=91943 RepID=A0A3M7GCY9_HORWE|nr:hypothetical protein BTJ68_14261 [Hortaea werneckii EXF-2000]RMY99029.1 hypothetical protein D0860_08391 [Hortaea werneckii]RMZ20162.1 hypothetical protein D0859_15836 [Hortaea werneckii]